MTDMTPQQRREIIAALQNGRKLEAIKLYREATGSDLMEAKTFIESLQQTLTTGRVPDGDSASSLSDEQRDRIIELLTAGQKLHAVKHYRDATGAGLKQAKDAVEAIADEHGIESVKTSGCGTAVFACVVVAITMMVLK